MTTIGEALASAVKKIDKLDSELLLGSILKSDRAHLMAFPEEKIKPEHLELYVHLVARCAQGEPVAYLLGEKYFWDFSLKVTQDTLIPRPETEAIIETLDRYADKEKSLSIVDMGTGSGAIAIALSRLSPHWVVQAVDYSERALLVAKENAQLLNANITFYQGSWYEALPVLGQQFDWIVSNPPYIDSASTYLNQPCLSYEPLEALVSADKGLADLRQLIVQAPSYLKDGGYICLEHGFDQSEAVASIASEVGFKRIEAVTDIHQIRRVYLGQLTNP